MMPTFMYTSLRVPANGSAPVLEKSDDIVERALAGMGPVWLHPRQIHPILLVCLSGRLWRLLFTWPGVCLSNSDRNQLLRGLPQLPVDEIGCQAAHQRELFGLTRPNLQGPLLE